MCGISGYIGNNDFKQGITAMVASQTHRGPDFSDTYIDKDFAALGHNRLAIIDLSPDAHQPFRDPSGRYVMVYNGEVYNYRELRQTLSKSYPFTTQSDTEVVLATFIQYGKDYVNHFNGMFAFAIWDTKEKKLFTARDRFGVKPFYYALHNNALYFASEIKALKAVLPKWGLNKKVWASYFAYGTYGMPDETFFEGINQLPGGHYLEYSNRKLLINRWYDFDERIKKMPLIVSETEAIKSYQSLLKDSISLRFRADVPVGINISGGVDSSLLLALINKREDASQIKGFTFHTGDARYDELPWVEAMIANTKSPLQKVLFTADEVASFSEKIGYYQDETYGGIPTLAYAKLFEEAKTAGVKVLLDGQEMDEVWAGYDYYHNNTQNTIQGIESNESPIRPACLQPLFFREAVKPHFPSPFEDDLLNKQYRDLFFTKIPRALRFNDRVSMAASVELREPFLDYRLVEFAFSLPLNIKFREGQTKFLLREMAAGLLHQKVVYAPKRPLQTPQREWLGNELKDKVTEAISYLKNNCSEYFIADELDKEWEMYQKGQQQSAFHLWQWVNFSFLVAKFENNGS